MHTEEEIIRWKRHWVDNDNRPDTVAKALNVCDTDMYPIVYRLLQIFGTIAVTSRECERSGSVDGTGENEWSCLHAHTS